MNRQSWIVFCLAYLVGLFSTGFVTFFNSELAWISLIRVGIGLGCLTIVAAWITRRCGFIGIRKIIWLEAFVIVILAVIYFHFRIPQPNVNDISNQLQENQSQLATVTGKLLTEPRLTGNEKVKLWVKVTEVETEDKNQQEVTGKLYVTLPLLQATGLDSGENLKIKGILYQPQSSKNPGAFNFKKYLNERGTFAGLKGWEVIELNNQSESIWGWWKIRRRIVRSLVRGLGSPVGQLVSSIILGRKAVDLPEELSDTFIQVGLAHILAASGFHVALLLGVILKLTNNFSGRSQLIIVSIVLFIYLCLTGLQPSVVRAILMGVFVLIALANNSKVRPLGSLLLAATIILLFNPLWIWDLGFQLSFLATLGLIVTVPPLSRYLDWLPPNLATAIAIPLAASIWTLPLLSYVFNTVAVYSLFVNILSTFLVSIISLGGMISGVIAVIIPGLGSIVAKTLYYPTILLIELTKLFTNLPGNTLAVGKISLSILMVTYGIIGLIWLNKWWQKRWCLGLFLTVTLIIIPISYRQLNLVQFTILADRQTQIVVIQDRGKVILINSGNTQTVKYAILPFLATQGINHIDYAIALSEQSDFEHGWSEINSHLTINNFVSNSENLTGIIKDKTKLISTEETIGTDSTKIKIIENQPPLLEITTKQQTWLMIGQAERQNQLNLTKYLQDNGVNPDPEIILWSGKKIEPEWLNLLTPQIAIASTNEVEETTKKQLNSQQIQLYITGQDGAISWKPKSGFQTTLITEADRNSFL
jgi:competence protein ComEC